MGSYKLVVGNASPVPGTAGTWSVNPPLTPDNTAVQVAGDGLTAIVDLAAVNASDTFLNCNPSLLTVYLDGEETPSGFPSGFTFLTANIRLVGSASSAVGNPSLLVLGWDGVDLFAYTVSTINSGPIVLALDITGLSDLTILSRIYRAKILASNFGVRQVIFDEFVITGEYDIESFTFAYTPNPAEGATVHPGDIITLTSPGTDPDTDLDLLELSILLGDTEITPIVQTQTLLTFEIPADFEPGLVTVYGVGNGTQFTGAEALVSYTITPVDGSGIYVLTPGKTDDTVYEDTASGDETVDIAIDNIYGKTGFVGG